MSNLQGQIQDKILDELSLERWFTEMGGPGSGHWRHAGRKGKRGGSAPKLAHGFGVSRETKEVVLPSNHKIWVDVEIAPLVRAFNNVRLKTGESCSGHTGSSLSVESYLSFRHAVRSEDKVGALRSLIASDKLQLKWTLKDKAMNWHELFLRDGLYGRKTLPSTSKNLESVKKDLLVLEETVR